MRCAQALEALLEAEPTEIAAGELSELAMHLRSCKKCAAVASAMRADLKALSAVMPAPAPPATVRSVPWRTLALCATASFVLFVVMRGAPEPRAGRPPAISTPAAAVVPETARIPDATSTRIARAPQVSRRVAEPRYAMPDLPSPLELSNDQERWALVRKGEVAVASVSVPSDGSVIVLKTSNPKITIIWFN